MDHSLLVLACVLLGALCLVLLAPSVRRFCARIQERDACARANRRRRAIENAKWRDIERRADLMANIHRTMRGVR